MRSPEKETELSQTDDMLVTRLDVTDIDSAKQAIKEGIDKFGTIDVLVNNAGYGGHALFEQFSDENVRAMYDTNVFGVMNTSREVLPIMRKQKSGVIINVTSVVGHVGIPATSTYSSTKFAVQGLSEAMAIEYAPFNVKIKTVAPGAFGTNFTAATVNDLEQGDEEVQKYTGKLVEHFVSVVEQFRTQSGKEADPQDVADIIFKCATEETPIHSVAGDDAEMMLGMKSSLPHQEFLEKVTDMVMPKGVLK
jgi:NAD(P)-dependent dehydrogenase (short-subunit alcohol dehydrogenase family)